VDEGDGLGRGQHGVDHPMKLLIVVAEQLRGTAKMTSGGANTLATSGPSGPNVLVTMSARS
jgi:hypothetical protein